MVRELILLGKSVRFPSSTNLSVVALCGSKQQELAQLHLCFCVICRTTYYFHNNCVYFAEVAGVTFSDSDSAPIPKFLNPDPGPEIVQIW